MTAFKAKVKAVYPKSKCESWAGGWIVTRAGMLVIGVGKTAFLAWVDAWRNIEVKNS